ncbi:hypothetical protein AWW66_01520 [Micromonospora rosaria]|uniref:Uncharacterized protein n=1 Tax=Micromonospora rosaria TaxID=47874 RepID=A0A136PYX4_9ACTN|nr:hypothetical protein [Micromonospora rosaria]KXK63670.1 hypothetical protein AWW66_01520 [Micromonospora rosaria]
MAIVTALLSAVYSYRLSRKAHRVATYYGVIGLFRELDKTFIEYPDVRPYFYDGKPVDVDGPTAYRIRAVAELVLDTFEWIWHRQKDLDTNGEDGWRAYIVDMFSSSPALQQHYAGSTSWYPGITRLIADRAVVLHAGTAGPGGGGTVERRGPGRGDGTADDVPHQERGA